MTIIERIVLTLEEKGKKMADLSRYIGLNTSTTTNWKTRNTDPPANLIAPICEFLGVSYSFLLTGTEDKSLLTDDEIVLLEEYRKLSDQQKRDILGAIRIQLMIDGAAEQEERLRQAK